MMNKNTFSLSTHHFHPRQECLLIIMATWFLISIPVTCTALTTSYDHPHSSHRFGFETPLNYFFDRQTAPGIAQYLQPSHVGGLFSRLKFHTLNKDTKISLSPFRFSAADLIKHQSLKYYLSALEDMTVYIYNQTKVSVYISGHESSSLLEHKSHHSAYRPAAQSDAFPEKTSLTMLLNVKFSW